MQSKSQAVALSLLALASFAAAQTKVCDAKAYGAKGDGATKDTASLQKAIDDCSAAGGGIVQLAGSPVFVSGPLVLKSNITLEIATGTTLAGSEDHDDYPEMQEFHETGRQPLLASDHAENITIKGGGTIDGRGQSWWPNRAPAYHRPRLIVFRYSKHIVIENVTVENSPSWQIVPYYSDDVTFSNMKIYAPEGESHNTDGIDPFSSGHITIDHVTIDTGDDNVAIKSGQPNSPGPDSPSHDIVITDCIFLHGHGMSIGSEVAGGVQNLRVERVHFKGTGSGVRIKSNRDRGNDIGHFIYRDLVMEDVVTPILITEFYPKIPTSIETEPVTRLTPHFHDILIENLTATGAKEAMVIVGLPESPILGLTLKSVHISAQKGATLRYVDIKTSDLKVQAANGKPMDVGAGVRSDVK